MVLSSINIPDSLFDLAGATSQAPQKISSPTRGPPVVIPIAGTAAELALERKKNGLIARANRSSGGTVPPPVLWAGLGRRGRITPPFFPQRDPEPAYAFHYFFQAQAAIFSDNFTFAPVFCGAGVPWVHADARVLQSAQYAVSVKRTRGRPVTASKMEKPPGRHSRNAFSRQSFFFTSLLRVRAMCFSSKSLCR